MIKPEEIPNIINSKQSILFIPVLPNGIYTNNFKIIPTAIVKKNINKLKIFPSFGLEFCSDLSVLQIELEKAFRK